VSAWIYERLARRAALEVAAAARHERWSKHVARAALVVALAVNGLSVFGAVAEGLAHPLVFTGLIFGAGVLAGTIYWIINKARSPSWVGTAAARHQALQRLSEEAEWRECRTREGEPPERWREPLGAGGRDHEYENDQ
jgi:hypothetical protein